ncbi:hypothetical protein [Methylobacterium sp. CM6247]
MIKQSNQHWTPKRDKCHDNGFHTGLADAVSRAFPPPDNYSLPDRIAAALEALHGIGTKVTDPTRR